MESKIRKLKHRVVNMRESDRDLFIFAVNTMNKVNEIIDHLNSQAQPEEKKWVGYIGEKYKEYEEHRVKRDEEAEIQLERFKYKPQDTPEEWEDNIECEEFYNLMQMYRHTPITEQERTVIAYNNVKKHIKQLLKEREREVLERLIEKRARLLFTEDKVENWFVWLTDITRELDKLDGRKQ